MRSFSWEIFVRAILLFFVAKLVNNKNHQEERRNRDNTHPSMSVSYTHLRAHET